MHGVHQPVNGLIALFHGAFPPEMLRNDCADHQLGAEHRMRNGKGIIRLAGCVRIHDDADFLFIAHIKIQLHTVPLS